MTDDGLYSLKSMLGLRELVLDWCHITGVGLRYLVGLARLERLELGYSRVLAGEDLREISTMTGLRRLGLRSCTRLCNLSSLAGLSLVSLDISLCPRITVGGLRIVAGISTLGELRMDGCRVVSDESLAMMLEVWKGSTTADGGERRDVGPQLLDIRRCRGVSSTTVGYLRKATNCEVRW